MTNQSYARQAIETKWIGPTNYRQGRVKATSGSGLTLTVNWEHALDVFGNHRRAALALAAKLGWDGPWVGGATRAGYCFVDAGHVS
jgi:hypothetical protein